MSDLKKYNPPPGSADLYLAASKHFQQAKLILESVPSPDAEVRKSICFYSILVKLFKLWKLKKIDKSKSMNKDYNYSTKLMKLHIKKNQLVC